MSLESLRKHLVNNRPQNLPSATLLGKGYGISTTQVTRLLDKMGYVRSTDNTGWHLEALTVIKEPEPTYLSISQATTDKVIAGFKKIVPEGKDEKEYAVFLLREAFTDDTIEPSKILKRLAVAMSLLGQSPFNL